MTHVDHSNIKTTHEQLRLVTVMEARHHKNFAWALPGGVMTLTPSMKIPLTRLVPRLFCVGGLWQAYAVCTCAKYSTIIPIIHTDVTRVTQNTNNYCHNHWHGWQTASCWPLRGILCSLRGICLVKWSFHMFKDMLWLLQRKNSPILEYLVVQ